MTDVPHKTIATLSGLGWIGKCVLLITEQYGPAIRLTLVLTDIPAELDDNSIHESSCGECDICVDVYPGHAPKGRNWNRELFRDDFFDVDLFRDSANKLSKERIGVDNTICGICIGSCKYTLSWLRSQAK